MNLHFITSLSKEYWDSAGKHCINTWNLPGQVTVYLEQSTGSIKWVNEIPYDVQLLTPPLLEASTVVDRRKVLKFWGKASAQITAVLDRKENERVIWLDSDIEQISHVDKELFDFNFIHPIATMNSNDDRDCWESGIVIFNQENTKLNQFIKQYNSVWNNEMLLSSLWKPYDAQVLGYVATRKGFLNLCNSSCKNQDALKNTQYANCFTHWINKDNKNLLKEHVK